MSVHAGLEKAERSKVLHLTAMGLSWIPRPVLQSVGLVRLDLAYNSLVSVPSTISSLSNLEQLWLQGNPIKDVHADIQYCTQLKVMDLRDTALTKLPREIGRLPIMLEIDLRGAPLKTKMKGFQRNTKGLMEYLRKRDGVKQIKVELVNKLSVGLYREVVNSPSGRHILPLVKAVCHAFTDLHELSQVARHCDRTFPPDLAQAEDAPAAAAKIRKKYIVLRRSNERKLLASQLELKMRALYYDVIDPTAVEGYIASIYKQIAALEDIQFIVKHATAILPPNPTDISGSGVESSMLKLQQEKADARQRCVDELFAALTHMYNDQEASHVLKLTQNVAAVFAKGKRFADSLEVEEMKQLKSNVQNIFPLNLREAEPIRVRTVFLAQQREGNLQQSLAV